MMRRSLVAVGLLMLPLARAADRPLPSEVIGDSGVARDGNFLLERCAAAERKMDGQEVDDIGMIGLSYCAGFLNGFTGVLSVYGEDVHAACLPKEGLSPKQALRVLVKYLKDHPEELHESELLLSFYAFDKAFPCKKKDGPKKE